MCECANVRMCECANVQMCECANVQMCEWLPLYAQLLKHQIILTFSHLHINNRLSCLFSFNAQCCMRHSTESLFRNEFARYAADAVCLIFDAKESSL